MPRALHSDETFDVAETDLPDLTQADAEVFYTVRPLTTQKFRDLQKAHTKIAQNKRTGRHEPELDGEAFADALFDFVLADWRGIVDKGAPAACSRENKLRLDGQVKQALIAVAGLNRIEGAATEKEQSFRPAS